MRVCKDLISYRCVADATGSGTRWEWSPRENISLWECRLPHARCLGGEEVSKRETPRLKGIVKGIPAGSMKIR